MRKQKLIFQESINYYDRIIKDIIMEFKQSICDTVESTAQEVYVDDLKHIFNTTATAKLMTVTFADF